MLKATKTISIALRAIDNVTKPIKKIVANAKTNLGSLSALEKSKARFNDVINRTTDLTSASDNIQSYGLKMVDALKNPLQVAMAFEAQMSKVKAITRASDSEIRQLTEAARHFGKTTSFSASQVAKAQEYLGMAGFKTPAIIDALPGMLATAKASGLELGKTADIISDIGSAFFGANASKHTSRLADVLTHTFTSANTDLSMLADTMKYTAPIANTVAMSLEETAMMSGLLANVGIKASNSGTALRAMISRLAAPPKAAAKALEKLNVQTKDAQGNLRPLSRIFTDIANAMESKGLGNADKVGMFADIAGLEASASMAELINQAGGKGLKEYFESFKNVEGRALSVAKIMGNNLQGKVTEWKSAFEDLQITVGTTLIPTLTKLMSEVITPMTQRFGTFLSENKEFVRNAIEIIAITGGILIAVGAAGKLIWTLNTIFAAFRLGTVALVASPIGLWVAGLTFAAVQIYRYWQPLAAFFSGLAQGLKGAFSPIVALFSPLVSGIKSLLQPMAVVNYNLESISQFGQDIGQNIGFGINILIDKFKNLKNTISGYISGSAFIQTVIDGIKSKGIQLYETVKGWLQKVRNLLPFSPAKEGPLSDLDKVGPGFINTIIDGIKKSAGELINAVKALAGKIKTSFYGLLSDTKNIIFIDNYNALTDYMRQIAKDTKELIFVDNYNAFTSLMSSILSDTKELIFVDTYNAIVSKLTRIYQFLKQVGTDTLDLMITDKMKAYLNSIISASTFTVNTIIGLVSNVISSLKMIRDSIVERPWFSMGMMGIVSFFDTLLGYAPAVRDFMFVFTQGIASALLTQNPLPLFASFAKLYGIIPSIKAGIASLKQNFLELIQLGPKAFLASKLPKPSIGGISKGVFNFGKDFVQNYIDNLQQAFKFLVTSWFMLSRAMEKTLQSLFGQITSLGKSLWATLSRPLDAKKIWGQFTTEAMGRISFIGNYWYNAILNRSIGGKTYIAEYFKMAVLSVEKLVAIMKILGVWKGGSLVSALITIGSLLYKNRENLERYAQWWDNFLSENIPGFEHFKGIVSLAVKGMKTYITFLTLPFKYLGKFIGNAIAQLQYLRDNAIMPAEVIAIFDQIKDKIKISIQFLKDWGAPIAFIIANLLGIKNLFTMDESKLRRFSSILLIINNMKAAFGNVIRSAAMLGITTGVLIQYWQQVKNAVAMSIDFIIWGFDTSIKKAVEFTMWWQSLGDTAKNAWKTAALAFVGGGVWMAMKVRSAIKGATCNPAYACASKLQRLGLIMKKIPGLGWLGNMMSSSLDVCAATGACIGATSGKMGFFQRQWIRLKLLMGSAFAYLMMGAQAAFSGLSTVFKGIGTMALSGIKAALPYIISGLSAVKTALLGFLAGPSAFIAANPIGAIIVAIVGIGLAIYQITQKWDDFKYVYHETMNSIKNTAGQYGTDISYIWQESINSIKNGFSSLKNDTFYILSELKIMVQNIFNEILTWILTSDWFQAGVSFIGKLISGIESGFATLIEKFKNIGGAIIAAMAGGTTAKMSAFKSMLSNGFKSVANLLPHSDAPEGPFSTLTKSGMAIPLTLAEGALKGSQQLKDTLNKNFELPTAETQGQQPRFTTFSDSKEQARVKNSLPTNQQGNITIQVGDIVINNANNEYDPMELGRVVREQLEQTLQENLRRRMYD